LFSRQKIQRHKTDFCLSVPQLKHCLFRNRIPQFEFLIQLKKNCFFATKYPACFYIHPQRAFILFVYSVQFNVAKSTKTMNVNNLGSIFKRLINKFHIFNYTVGFEKPPFMQMIHESDQNLILSTLRNQQGIVKSRSSNSFPQQSECWRKKERKQFLSNICFTSLQTFPSVIPHCD